MASLRKLYEEATAQINPFDGGKTAATVRAAAPKPAPAVTPKPGTPSLPRRILNAGRDLVDANTQDDQQRRLSAGRPADYQAANAGGVVAGLSQRRTDLARDVKTIVNPSSTGADRTEAIIRRVAPVHPTTAIPYALSGAMDKFPAVNSAVNKAAAPIVSTFAPSKISSNIQQILGTTLLANDPTSEWGKQLEAGAKISRGATDEFNHFASGADVNHDGTQLHGNKYADIAASTLGNIATNIVAPGLQATSQGADTTFAAREAGASPEAAITGGATSALVSYGASKLSSNSLLGKEAGSVPGRIIRAGTTGAVDNIAQNTVDNAVAQRTYDPNRKLTDNIVPSAVGGFVLPAIIRGGAELANPKNQAKIKDTASKVADKTGLHIARPAPLSDDEVAVIQAFRNSEGSINMPDEVYNGAKEALAKIGVKYTDSGRIDDILGAFRTYNTRKAQAEGGYISNGKDPNAAEVKQLQDHLAKHGTDGDYSQENYAAQQRLAELKAPEKVTRGKQPKTTELNRGDPANIIKKAENDYISGKISADDLENIRNNPDSQAPVAGKNETATKLNTNRLNVSDKQKGDFERATNEVVTRLSNEQVIQAAKDAGIDTRSHTVDQTREIIAKQLNTRQDAVRLSNQAEAARQAGDTAKAAELLKQAAEQGRTSRQQGTDVARQLQARRIIANELDTPQHRIFKLLDEAGVNPDVYAKRFATVDFNSPKEVITAYRDLVPAKFGNWIDLIRYNSMLSSPLTHAANIFSNAVNVGVVAPVEKTVRGAFDAIGGLFGKPREYAAGEGAAYAKGAVRNLGKARDAFVAAMSGGEKANQDLNEYSMPVAVSGTKGKIAKTLSVPMNLLDSADKFFRALASGGEEAALNLRESKGIKVKGDREALTTGEADYRLFQEDTNLKGQGAVLQTIDHVTNTLMDGRRKIRALKWVLPFIKTPTNILKQGIEYSPLGFVNLKGNADKTTAFTRAAIGTAVFGAAAAAVATGDATWGEPTDQDQKAAFRAEGKQPYSIKIGDKWVSFTKLPPAISFPLALMAGVNDAVNTKKMSESTAEAVMSGVAKFGGFLSDQSYLKSIGDTLGAFKGDTDKFAQAIANYPQQLVPFRALTGWLARMTDSTDRKIDGDKGWVEQQVQALMMQYPGIRENVPAREDPFTKGELAVNNNVFNNLSPVKVTYDKGFGNTTNLTVDQRELQRDLPAADKETYRAGIMAEKGKAAAVKEEQAAIKKGDEPKKQKAGTVSAAPDRPASDAPATVRQLSNGKYYAKIGEEYKTYDSKSEADDAVKSHNTDIEVNKFKDSSAKTKLIGDQYYFKKKNGTVDHKSKFDYEADKVDSKISLSMDRAKASDNLASWREAASAKYDLIQQKIQQYDPETESDQIDKLTLQAENLADEAAKYASYGGFKKGSGGAGSKSKYKLFAGSSNPISTGKSLRAILAAAKVSKGK